MMTAYPGLVSYTRALRNPSAALVAPELQGAVVAVDDQGEPLTYPGQHCITFAITVQGQRCALRCFLHDVGDLLEQYQKVTAHLSSSRLPYFVSTCVQIQAVRVEGEVYPALVMEWTPGVSLGKYVEEHLDPHLLHELAKAWRRMMRDLHDHRIAHGDLQHENVVVEERGRDLALRLIDYDTMVVPAVIDRLLLYEGHPAFRHPAPHGRRRILEVDRFPGLAVYTALAALAVAPDLWKTLGADGDSGLLFTAQDFSNPGASRAIQAIEELGGECALLARALKNACTTRHASEVPLIEDVLATPPTAHSGTAHPPSSEPGPLPGTQVALTQPPPVPYPTLRLPQGGLSLRADLTPTPLPVDPPVRTPPIPHPVPCAMLVSTVVIRVLLAMTCLSLLGLLFYAVVSSIR